MEKVATQTSQIEVYFRSSIGLGLYYAQFGQIISD